MAIFTARCYAYAAARCVSARPSVCPSVTRRYSVETARRIIELFSPVPNGMAIFRWRPLNGGVEHNGVWEKSRFSTSTNIALYLRNDTRYGHSYYRIRIGNLTQPFEWYHFQWPWVTLNPDFKVTPVFNAEYLWNGTRYRDNFNAIGPTNRGLHAPYTQGCHFEWPWAT